MPRSMIDRIRKKRTLLQQGTVSVDDLHRTNDKRFEESPEEMRPSSAPPDTSLPEVEQPETTVMDKPEFISEPELKKITPPLKRTKPLRKKVQEPSRSTKPKGKKIQVQEEFPSTSKESQAFTNWITNGRSDDMDRLENLLFGRQ